MDTQTPRTIAYERSHHEQSFKDMALGLVSTRSFPAIVWDC